MAIPDPLGIGKLVPGFDFLQNLSKQAAQNIPQIPNVGNWIAPTLNVEELDKRLQELKQVQYWLDQNATALAAVIQALEVQKMTLATLKDMNFNLGDVANAFKLKAADAVMGGVGKAMDAARSLSGSADAHGAGQAKGKSKFKAAKSGAASGGASSGVPDPMQWWGAVTKQFADIAGSAMKEASQKTALDAAKNMATGLAKGGMKAAQETASQMGRTATNMANLASAAAAPRKAVAKTAVKEAVKAPAKPVVRAKQPNSKPAIKRATKTVAFKSPKR